jgi:hypothetical protein
VLAEMAQTNLESGLVQRGGTAAPRTLAGAFSHKDRRRYR